MQTKKKISLIIFGAALLLLAANLYQGFVESNFNYWSIGSNLLLAFAMLFNYLAADKASAKENR